MSENNFKLDYAAIAKGYAEVTRNLKPFDPLHPPEKPCSEGDCMMANSIGESVGDMIVRVRIEEMAAHPQREQEIRSRFIPRSLVRRSWPLAQKECVR